MVFSLYVHIPFCLKRCIYCDFVSGIYDPEKEGAYLQAIKKEIHNISYGNYPSPIPLPQGEGVRGRVFSSLYIGGGTPTVLSADALSDLITCIFKQLSFVKNYEATIEANPGTLGKEKLSAIFSSGINRISIGVQSFNDDELNLLGRLHSSHDAEQAVYLARDAGFENIGIDLIYGIPEQNIESWKKTLEKAVNLKPKHISTYELTVEKGTLLYEYMKADAYATNNTKNNNCGSCHSRVGGNPEQSGKDMDSCFRRNDGKGQRRIFKEQHKLIPLKEEKIIEMYNYAIDYLESEGFVHYEISNFALPDYFCRHNLNYWDRGEYYGVGLGAHYFIKRKRFHNTAILDDYINLISADKSPVKETEEITEDKAMSEAIFLGLRKTTGINLKTFYQTQGSDILTVYHKEIKELQEAGLLELREDNMRLTRKGLLLSNEVFIKFI
ncbi:MAG: radical SAM family heme chaperone HemW [Thermodesulfovibrionia bacterium]|nr:radical SAM family heme chaperone HemW [Thermodesulfovibrionia bacterium]